MRPALHAEWTKIRTLASPRWLLLGTIAVFLPNIHRHSIDRDPAAARADA